MAGVTGELVALEVLQFRWLNFATGTQLSRGRWAFAFALVTSLFFTWGFAYGVCAF